MKTKKKNFKWPLNKHLLVSDNLPCVDLYSAIRAQRDIKIQNVISGLSSSSGAYLIRVTLRWSVISTQLPMTNASPLPSDTTRSQVLHRSTALSLCAYPASTIGIPYRGLNGALHHWPKKTQKVSQIQYLF